MARGCKVPCEDCSRKSKKMSAASCARLAIAADGSFDDPVCEYDRPPAAEKLRTLGNYVADLERYPRPPALVPG